MELFAMEHKKLWKRTGVRVSVLLCFLYVVVMGSFLSYQWLQFGTSDGSGSSFGNHFDGYAGVRARQAYADQWKGPLTDGKLQQMVADFQRMAASGEDKAYDTADWLMLNNLVRSLWPELEERSRNELMLKYVKPEKLTGFYERRRALLEEFMEMNSMPEAEKEYFRVKGAAVKEPFDYDWAAGWFMVNTSMGSELGMILALFIAIALSPMFSGEWHGNTQPVIFTSKNGWKETALAKICAGMAFTLELALPVTAGAVAMQLIFLGTRGWDMPIQFIKLIAATPLNMLQAEVYQYGYALLAALGYAGVVMLISSLTKSNFASLIGSMAVVYLPMALAQFLPYGVQQILALIPLAGSPTDIFRMNVYHIFGKIVWSPYLLITVPFCVGLACIPAAVRGWSRRAKA